MSRKRTPPRGRVSLPKDDEPKKRLNLLCFRCGTMYRKQQGSFSKVRSTFYEQNAGYLHVCNTCLDSLFAHYRAVFDGDLQQCCYTMCLNFNIYYSVDIFNAAKNSPSFEESPFRAYISRSNMVQFKKWTDFTDTIDQEAISSGLVEATQEEVVSASLAQDERPSQEVLDRWGGGYSNPEYAFMQSLYKSLMKQKRNPTPLQESVIIDACKYKCQHNRFLQDGDSKASDIKTLSALYQDALKVIGLDVSPKNDGVDEGTFGAWVREIERFCPAENYKDKKKYRDMDGLGEYVERFMFRPLRNWLTGSNEKDPEFNIGGEEDV